MAAAGTFTYSACSGKNGRHLRQRRAHNRRLEPLMRDLFRGKLVRFMLEDPEIAAKADVRWQRDSEYHRLMDSEPARLYSVKKIKEWIEKQVESGFEPERYFFS